LECRRRGNRNKTAFGDIGNPLNMWNAAGGDGGSGGFDSMAKFVVLSLTSRIENESK